MQNLPQRSLIGGGRKIVSHSNSCDAELQKAIQLSVQENKQVLQERKRLRHRIRQQLPPQSNIVNILADGNCLFRAVSRGLSQLHMQFNHVELRQMRVDSIRSNFSNRFHDQIDFHNYVSAMACNAEYGDELCIQALALSLHVFIEVFSPDHNPQRFGNPDHPGIRIAYNGSNHFDVILHDTSEPSVSPILHVSNAPKPSGHDASNGASFCVISSNITSLRKNWPLLCSLPADLYLCQETTLNTNGQNSMKRHLSNMGYVASFGPASLPKLSGSQKSFSLWNACSGGLATIAKSHVRFTHIQCDGEPFRSGKCSLSWIPTGIARRGVYIYNIYGFVGAGPKNADAYQKNELLPEQIFTHASSLGDSPILLIGDFQTCPDASRVLGTVIHSGRYHDLGHIYTNNEWTFQKGADENIRTRIDLAICNTILLPFISSCHVLSDTGLPSHRPIQIEFTFAKVLDTKWIYRKPKRLNLLPCAKELVEKHDAKVWSPHTQSFRESCQQARISPYPQSHIDSLFHTWSSVSESALLAAEQNFGTKFRGRGLQPRVVKINTEAPPLNHSLGAANIRLLSLHKLKRRLHQLRSKLSCAAACLDDQQTCNVQCNILQSWRRLFPTLPAPSLHSCLSIAHDIHVVDVALSEEQRILSQSRMQSFKQFLIADWNSTKKATYKWMRNSEPPVIPIFNTGPHEYAFRHSDIHQLMVDTWSPIFNRYQLSPEPSFETFLADFPNCLPQSPQYHADKPFCLDDILPSDVSNIVQSLKQTSAGVDAWQVEEIQFLGRHSVSALAALFNEIEHTGTWPSQLSEVPVAALKKPTGCTPKDIRPIALSSLVYRIWARLRWQHLQSWYHSWIPDQLKGGIKGRHAIDAYYSLMVEIEHCHHSNSPLYGVLYDYQKCFDMVPWSIEVGLLNALGLPQRVLRPMFSFAKSMLRRLKIGNSLGPAFSNTNSIMQGCPLAILRINCIIAAWVRVLSHHPSSQLCRLSAYTDDKNMRSNHLESLQNAINVTDRFDKAIDARVNVDKTATFANTAQGLKAIAQLNLDGITLQPVSQEKLLGGQMSFASKRSLKLANKRAEAFLAVSKRVMICPLNDDARASLLSTIGAAKYTYGLELGGCSIQLERTLRSSILACIWHKRPSKCSDVVLTLCFKGHQFDPTQLRLFAPFSIARRQLAKHAELQQMWTFTWIQSCQARSAQTNRSLRFGPLAILQSVSNTLSMDWISPFEFKFQLSNNHVIIIHLLHGTDAYFHHILRFVISQYLWSRAAQRTSLASLRSGVDKVATLRLHNSRNLEPYAKGVLRGILADAITTQKYLFRSKRAAFPTCPFCWKDEEDLEHLFWKCENWSSERSKHLSMEQLRQIPTFPISVRRAGIFPLTSEQTATIMTNHRNLVLGNKADWPTHMCNFPVQLQRAMIAVICARNQTQPDPPPEHFEFPPSPQPVAAVPTDIKQGNPQVQPPQSEPSVKVTHDDLGLLLSTSNRPGSSKYQYVIRHKECFFVL